MAESEAKLDASACHPLVGGEATTTLMARWLILAIYFRNWRIALFHKLSAQQAVKQPSTRIDQSTPYSSPHGKYLYWSYHYKRRPKLNKAGQTGRVSRMAYRRNTVSGQPNTVSAKHCIRETLYQCSKNTVSVQQNTVSVQQKTVSVQGNTVSVQPNTVSVQQKTVSVQGNTVSVQPNTVSVQGNTVSVQGNTVSLQGKLYQCRETLYKRSETLYQRSETLYQCRETLYQCSETLYKCSETLYQRSETLYQCSETLYQRSSETLYQCSETLYQCCICGMVYIETVAFPALSSLTVTMQHSNFHPQITNVVTSYVCYKSYYE